MRHATAPGPQPHISLLNLFRLRMTNNGRTVSATRRMWGAAMRHEDEIAQIGHELALLRARYASYGRSAALMQTIFRVLIPAGAIAAAVLAAELLLFDVLYGLFFIGAVLIVVAAASWFVGSLHLRWIDFVSQAPRGVYNTYFYTPDIDPHLRANSDAELIERQIADRERRLSELGVGDAGGHTVH